MIVLVFLMDSFLLCYHSGFPWHTLDDRSLEGLSSVDIKPTQIWVLKIVVGDTSNFHFDTIPSNLAIVSSTIPILDNAHAHNALILQLLKYKVDMLDQL